MRALLLLLLLFGAAARASAQTCAGYTTATYTSGAYTGVSNGGPGTCPVSPSQMMPDSSCSIACNAGYTPTPALSTCVCDAACWAILNAGTGSATATATRQTCVLSPVSSSSSTGASQPALTGSRWNFASATQCGSFPDYTDTTIPAEKCIDHIVGETSFCKTTTTAASLPWMSFTLPSLSYVDHITIRIRSCLSDGSDVCAAGLDGVYVFGSSAPITEDTIAGLSTSGVSWDTIAIQGYYGAAGTIDVFNAPASLSLHFGRLVNVFTVIATGYPFLEMYEFEAYNTLAETSSSSSTGVTQSSSSSSSSTAEPSSSSRPSSSSTGATQSSSSSSGTDATQSSSGRPSSSSTGTGQGSSSAQPSFSSSGESSSTAESQDSSSSSSGSSSSSTTGDENSSSSSSAAAAAAVVPVIVSTLTRFSFDFNTVVKSLDVFILQFRFEVAQLTDTDTSLIIVNSVYAGSTIVNATMPQSTAVQLAVIVANASTLSVLSNPVLSGALSATVTSSTSGGDDNTTTIIIIVVSVVAALFLAGGIYVAASHRRVKPQAPIGDKQAATRGRARTYGTTASSSLSAISVD